MPGAEWQPMDLALFRSCRISSYRFLWGGTWPCTFLPLGHSTCTWGTHSNQQQARESHEHSSRNPIFLVLFPAKNSIHVCLGNCWVYSGLRSPSILINSSIFIALFCVASWSWLPVLVDHLLPKRASPVALCERRAVECLTKRVNRLFCLASFTAVDANVELWCRQLNEP